MSEQQREGVLVTPFSRLDEKQIKLIDETSREILENLGILCYNKEAAEIFTREGAESEDAEGCVKIKIPSKLIDRILETVPSAIVLGARNPENRMVLDAYEPRVRFVSGSETNITLKVDYSDGTPKYISEEGSIPLLAEAAHLCNRLENLDSFIRCVNIREKAITAANKDVNKFATSLNNITKHVMAGLTDLNSLENILKMGEIVAGGKEAFIKNPVLSFITCVIKSPLQMVDDTASKLIAISKRKAPVVISSSPMGGATAPFDEYGMVAQINAELLAGIALNQLVSPGAPVLYGSVPVRTRLDNLNDMYGAPDFNHYHHDAAQLARYYGIPCYSTAGVGDTDKPGIQATFEKMLTLSYMPWTGAQYIHYAFGLLDRTNIFCQEQAIIDDAHIGIIKHNLKSSNVQTERKKEILDLITEVMESDHKTYVYNLPLPTVDDVYVRYPLEAENGDALYTAWEKRKEIMSHPSDHLPSEMRKELKQEIPGLLDESLAERRPE